jgi:phosphoribosyl-AMP cyclohydrolase
MVDRAWLDGWVERLRAAYPTAVAVLLAGSYARGTAGRKSDVDLQVILPEGDKEYRAYFELRPDGSYRHVSAGIRPLADWHAKSEEAAAWALSLPAQQYHRLLWATPEARTVLGDEPTIRQPAGPVELEDFQEWAAKVRSALDRGDGLALRWAAQQQARLLPAMLCRLNAPVRAGTPFEAVRVALDFSVAPARYREDMLVCLGLTAEGHTDAEVAAAAERLNLGTLRLLRERGADIVAEVDLREALVAGVLEAYAAQ